MATKKLTISLDEKILELIDDYSNEIGVSRSAAITFLINQGFMVVNQPKQLSQLNELLNMVQQGAKE